MTSKAPTIRRHHLQRFVTDFKEKAVDILLRCCHDENIEKEIVDVLLEVPTSAANNPHTNNTHLPPAAKTYSNPQRAAPIPSGHHRQASNGYVGPNEAPPSPPKTRSNQSKSISGRDSTENIVILSLTEEDEVKKSVAIMKLAQTNYSVIGEHMIKEGRIPGNNVEDIDEQWISIPKKGAPGSSVSVKVTSCAELTWKRMKPTRFMSQASHSTVFYLVAQELLDIDVLLGNADSGEDQAFDLQEGESFHRSDHVSRAQPDEIVHNLRRSQLGQMSQVQRATPVARPKQSDEELRASIPAAADPVVSDTSGGQTAAQEKVRISCKLGSTKIGVRLDLDDAHPGAFIDNVRKEFRRRDMTFDQSNTAIRLKPAEQMPDKDGHFVSLDEDDLEDNWTDIIHWLRTNKHQNSNVMYGVFQIDDDSG